MARSGFSVPAAIGAKIGRPDAGKVVIPIIGDGGYQFTMSELGTAVQERICLPIVIFNDSTYSAVKEAQSDSRGGRYIGVDLVNPDYVDLAKAYRIPGVRAHSPEELEREIALALERDLPHDHRCSPLHPGSNARTARLDWRLVRCAAVAATQPRRSRSERAGSGPSTSRGTAIELRSPSRSSSTVTSPVCKAQRWSYTHPRSG